MYIYNEKILKGRRRDLRNNQTPYERLLWVLLRNKKCRGYKFIRQYSVGPYILDFYCPKLKLAIEVDGGQHNRSVQKDYDKERTAYLEGNGIKELRFWNNEISGNIEGVYEEILKNCP